MIYQFLINTYIHVTFIFYTIFLQENYTMFGVPFSMDDQIVRPLEEQVSYNFLRESLKLNCIFSYLHLDINLYFNTACDLFTFKLSHSLNIS